VRTQEYADENSTFYRDAARDNCQQPMQLMATAAAAMAHDHSCRV